MADPHRIRVVALAVVHREGDLLVFSGTDPTKGETFYRPLGGGVEFGETAEAALRREFREELAVELDGVEPLGTLENLFTFDGRPGHEIVLLFRAALRDHSLYERDPVGTVLDDGSPVLWLPQAAVVDGSARLYPDGLLGLLTTAGA